MRSKGQRTLVSRSLGSADGGRESSDFGLVEEEEEEEEEEEDTDTESVAFPG